MILSESFLLALFTGLEGGASGIAFRVTLVAKSCWRNWRCSVADGADRRWSEGVAADSCESNGKASRVYPPGSRSERAIRGRQTKSSGIRGGGGVALPGREADDTSHDDVRRALSGVRKALISNRRAMRVEISVVVEKQLRRSVVGEEGSGLLRVVAAAIVELGGRGIGVARRTLHLLEARPVLQCLGDEGRAG